MPEQTSNQPQEEPTPPSTEAAESASQQQPDPQAEAAEPAEESAASEAPEGAEAAGDEQEGPTLPENEVLIEDAGTLRKKVTVKVPRERIDAKFDEMFGELSRSAQVPGFRIGHAPRRLIEKRFGREVGEDVRNSLVGEALGTALDRDDLTPIGEPDLDLEKIELPDEGELEFSFEVEVAPEFELPDYDGLEIERPSAAVTDEQVEETIGNLLGSRGRLVPTEGPAEAGDVVVTDVTISGEGIDRQVDNLELRVAPAQVEGIILEDLGTALTGAKPGETISLTAQVPEAHPEADWRGKEAKVAFRLHELKRFEAPELTEEFAAEVGFESVEELRRTVRRSIEARSAERQQRAMRTQVEKYFLEHTSFDLPEGVVQRHAGRLAARQYLDLLYRGVPREQVERRRQELEARAASQAQDELKLAFILEKVADAEEVTVEDDEINARIAEMARQYDRRPERVRQEMRDDGTIEQLARSLREEKAVEKVLANARIADAAPADEAEGEQDAST